MVFRWGRENSICFGFWVKRNISPFGHTITTCGLYTRSTKKVRIGTSWDGQTEAASFQKAATSSGFLGKRELHGPDYTGRSSKPRERVEPLLLADRRCGPVTADDGKVPRRGRTAVSRMDARIVSVSPPQRSVRPIERRKSVSPEKRTDWSPSSRKQVEPGVWPGVWIARRTCAPKEIVSPSRERRVRRKGRLGGEAEETPPDPGARRRAAGRTDAGGSARPWTPSMRGRR